MFNMHMPLTAGSVAQFKLNMWVISKSFCAMPNDTIWLYDGKLYHIPAGGAPPSTRAVFVSTISEARGWLHQLAYSVSGN